MSDSVLVHYEVRGKVALLTLDDPPANTYTHEMMRQLDESIIKARFDDVSGLRLRSKVTMAGVTIGRVSGIDVDMLRGDAEVTMEIDGEEGGLTLDTGAKILTEGVLGARYVSLVPGADPDTLRDGDYILDEFTQGAFVLENLIGDIVTRLGAS